jgi:hypothetical protein
VRNVSLLAIGVNEEGFREVLAVPEGSKEDKASWKAFLRHLKERGLQGIRLFVSDKFRLPFGEPSTTRATLQQMCEKSWTLPKFSFTFKRDVLRRVYQTILLF